MLFLLAVALFLLTNASSAAPLGRTAEVRRTNLDNDWNLPLATSSNRKSVSGLVDDNLDLPLAAPSHRESVSGTFVDDMDSPLAAPPQGEPVADDDLELPLAASLTTGKSVSLPGRGFRQMKGSKHGLIPMGLWIFIGCGVIFFIVITSFVYLRCYRHSGTTPRKKSDLEAGLEISENNNGNVEMDYLIEKERLIAEETDCVIEGLEKDILDLINDREKMKENMTKMSNTFIEKEKEYISTIITLQKDLTQALEENLSYAEANEGKFENNDQHHHDQLTILAKKHGGFRRNALLKWCQECTENYSGINISNFSSSWSDGLALCALLHSLMPGKINYLELLHSNDPRTNFTMAFQAAESAGISTTLNMDEMMDPDGPNWRKVMAYITNIYKCFTFKFRL